jgi:hypothetical protein
MKTYSENQFDNQLKGCGWFILAVILLAVVIWQLTSCAAPAEVIYYDQYQPGGCYTIKDTTINGNQYLIGTK